MKKVSKKTLKKTVKVKKQKTKIVQKPILPKGIQSKVIRFSPEIKIHSTPEILIEETAHLLMQIARASVQEKGRFVVALSGGSTPRGLFQHLAEEPYFSLIPWAKTFVFWVDERHVPFADATSNYRMTQETLLSKVPIPKEQVFPMTNGSLPVDKAASAYEMKLRKFFEGYSLPCFDLTLMGMGEDGHTASLFPGMPQVNEQDKWVVGYFVDPEKKERVSLTFPVLNHSRLLLVLTEGAKKADRLKEVLEGPSEPPRYPIQYLRPLQGRLIFAIDALAGSKL
ncbi:MAG TPA: 6-phosphogluconolactonase [bacterium]|jgi:6-phosphogluconolactonase|nr:6-phosphogluconolactonase [bacterium]